MCGVRVCSVFGYVVCMWCTCVWCVCSVCLCVRVGACVWDVCVWCVCVRVWCVCKCWVECVYLYVCVVCGGVSVRVCGVCVECI